MANDNRPSCVDALHEDCSCGQTAVVVCQVETYRSTCIYRRRTLPRTLQHNDRNPPYIQAILYNYGDPGPGTGKGSMVRGSGVTNGTLQSLMALHVPRADLQACRR